MTRRLLYATDQEREQHQAARDGARLLWIMAILALWPLWLAIAAVAYYVLAPLLAPEPAAFLWDGAP